MSKGLTLIVPEDEVRRYPEWTPCEAFRFAPLVDGTVKFEVKGIEPPPVEEQCDWCSGKGYAVQYGPNHQEARIPCSNCGGSGRKP